MRVGGGVSEGMLVGRQDRELCCSTSPPHLEPYSASAFGQAPEFSKEITRHAKNYAKRRLK